MKGKRKQEYNVTGSKLHEIRSILANKAIPIDPDDWPKQSRLLFKHVNAMRSGKGVNIQVVEPPGYRTLRRLGRYSRQTQTHELGPGQGAGGFWSDGPANKPAWTDDRWHDDEYYIANNALLKYLKSLPECEIESEYESEPEPEHKPLTKAEARAVTTKFNKQMKHAREMCATQ